MSRGCAFLPCAGEYSGGWQDSGAAGFYWGGDASATQPVLNAAGITFGTSASYAPVRMIKVWE